MATGFVRFVEVGQYFMTKDTGDFRQFRSVICREYTLPRNDPASQPKGWIQGNMRIGPVLEVTTRVQYGKHGIEIRIWAVAQDNSQSWFRISYKQYRNSFWSTRRSRNHNRENLLIHQLSYLRTKEDGLILSHQKKLSLRTIFTQSNSTAGTRWINSILQNQIQSSNTFLTSTALVSWSLEILFGSRRRFNMKISVLLW